MKEFLILVLLLLEPIRGEKIVKRFVNDQTNTTDSFQVNVSAGYGVHSDNTTLPSPVYKFHERQVANETAPLDQLSDASQSRHQVVPTPTYQVHERSPEIQEKNFRVKYQPLRQKNTRGFGEHKDVAAGTKIVEVLRVPAMYELHLQSDPQRLAALNTAWLTKLIMQNRQQQFYQPPKQLQAQASTHLHQKVIPQQKSPRAQAYQTGYHSYHKNQNTLAAESVQKPIVQTTTSSYDHQLNNEISSDFYQKPQALHEVPAPVLNNPSYKYETSKVKPTIVPSLIYGKPVESTTQAALVTASPWGDNGAPSYQEQPSRYYQETPGRFSQYHRKRNIFDSPNYHGYRNVQNHYNDAIGDHLDQNLGGLAAYLNTEGTMTVADFHHGPKLYRTEIPVTENLNSEDGPPDFGMLPYNLNFVDNQENHLTNPGYEMQNPADFSNALFVNPRYNGEEAKKSYAREHASRRMNRRYNSSKRRPEPMDYILYIKERTLD